MSTRIMFFAVFFGVAAVVLAADEQDGSGFTSGLKNATESVKGFFGGMFESEGNNATFSDGEDYSVTKPPTSAGAAGVTRRGLTPPAEPAVSGTVSRQQVRQIQGRLNALGYPAGTPDGIAGKNTHAAIAAYQKAAGLTVTGKPSNELLRHLLRSDAPRAAGMPRLVAHGTAMEAHVYEGALEVGDYVCEDMVDEFSISGGLLNIFKSGATSVGGWVEGVLGSDQGGDAQSAKSDLDRIVEEARIAAKRTNWMPLSIEKMYGEQLHKRRLTQAPSVIMRKKRGPVARKYEQADAVLAKLLAEIPEEHEYDFKLFLTSDADVNAEALPGGYLYVSTGTLEQGLTELVLGHELSHVTKRHTTRELQARLIDSVSTVDDLKALMKERDLSDVTNRVKTLEARFLHYSRQQELQADACAVRLASGLRSFNLAQAINNLIRRIGGAESVEKQASSSHPSYPDRKERMLQAMDAH